ncbi:hypothetical protein A5784_10110 [Mycobacterium sp. 852013-50091_SCH5140682]|nr:hypothetical protein A5784_10110 [Mycobacterium sp. 852013-50091_SCH5140682]
MTITRGGAIGLRIPMAGLPHGIRSPSDVKRTPNAPSICLARSRAVAESISALAAATSAGSASERMVASISARTESASGS